MLRRAGIVPIIAGLVLAVLVVGAVAAIVILHEHEDHRKEAGPLKELGKFDAGAIIVREVVGNVMIVSSNVSGVVVKSNLPVKVHYSDGLITVYCPAEDDNACNDYRDGRVIIEVGKKLADVVIHKTVGDVEVDVNATRLVFEDIVGDVRASAPAEYKVEDVVGDVSIHAEGEVRVSNVVGDVTIGQ